MSRSDGSTADYYVLPEGATQLQDLISHRNMNAQIGEITRACYRYGMASHSDMLRDAKKIRFYAQAEVERLEKLSAVVEEPSHIISDVPSWDDAPEWANWLAQDSNGWWYWFEIEPYQEEACWNFGGDEEYDRIRAIDAIPNPNWRNTLQSRPTSQTK